MVYVLMFAVANVRSSGVLHRRMLISILQSPMTFFETTPVGRILNRFSRDLETIDNVIPQQMRNWLQTFLTALSTVIIISYSTPVFLSVVVPLFVIYYFVQVSNL
jgi:ABC-type multidrug transport system fused ATPase/permease subunit